MTDLRTLAQAVVDAHASVADVIHAIEHQLPDAFAGDRLVRWSRYNAAAHACFGEALTEDHHAPARKARAIRAALDDERAQGYARAMGEVVERCAVDAPSRTGGPLLRLAHHAAWRSALAGVADWARERAAAAARERETPFTYTPQSGASGPCAVCRSPMCMGVHDAPAEANKEREG